MNRSLHQLDQTFCDGQAKPCSLHGAVSFGIHLFKVVKNLFQILLFDAASCILNPKGKHRHIVCAALLCSD